MFFADILYETVEPWLVMPILRTLEQKQHFQKMLLTLKGRAVFQK